MKILFLTTQIPYPPDNGIRIVPYNAMRLLAASGVELGLCVLTRESDMSERAALDQRIAMLENDIPMTFASWLPAVKHSRSARLKLLLSGEMSYVADYISEDYRVEIGRHVQQFQPDVVHFDHISLLQYRNVLALNVGTVASINDSHTLTLAHQLRNRRDKGLLRVARYVQFLQTRRFERNTYGQFDAVHVMTAVDAEYLRKLCTISRVNIIPNGVDDSLFAAKPSAGQNKKVVFVGRLHGNNLHSVTRFIEDGWPVVRAAHPDAELHLVGQASQDVANQLGVHALQGVVLAGYVSRLADAYGGARVSISPIDKDSGVLNKTIEAMAAGVPVVSFTSSLKGLVSDNQPFDAPGGDTCGELGEAVAQLLGDPDRCRSISDTNRSYAARNYSWNSRAADYLSMYDSAVLKASLRAS